MDNKFKALLAIFFLSFVLFVITITLDKNLLRKATRAKEDYLPSVTNSLVFAYPLIVKADGATESVVNVFVRSDKGMPVKDQKVSIKSSLGMVKESELTTDEKGKVSFHLSSSESGVSQIQVLVGGTLTLTQKLSVKFE